MPLRELEYDPFERSAPPRLREIDYDPFENDEGPGSISRGFVSGLLKQNPEMLAESLEGMSFRVDPSFKDTLTSASADVRKIAHLSPDEYATRATALFDSKNLSDVMTSLGETFGQGLASTVPSVISGTMGAVAGRRVAGRAGQNIGGVAGAAFSSAPMNYGEVYKAIKEAGVDPDKASEYAMYAAGPITALDVGGISGMVARLGGMGEVKSQLARAIARRVAEESAKGTATEGITEAIQETIKNATVSVASGKPFWTAENLKSTGEALVGGAMVGGAIGGATGVLPDRPIAGDPGAAAEPSALSPNLSPAAQQTRVEPTLGPQPQRPPTAEEIASPVPTDLLVTGTDFIDAMDGSDKAGPTVPPPPPGLQPAAGIQPQPATPEVQSDQESRIVGPVPGQVQQGQEPVQANVEEGRPGAPATGGILPQQSPSGGNDGQAVAPTLRTDGKPWQTEKAALLAGKTRKDLKGKEFEAVQVEGGYGLRLKAQETPPPVEGSRAAVGAQASESAQPAPQPPVSVPGAGGPLAPAAPQSEAGVAPAKPLAPEHVPHTDQGDGTRVAPVDIKTAADMDIVRDRIARRPTDGQIDAVNYAHGHATWNGLKLGFETPKGGERRSKADAPTPWVVPRHPTDYGKIKGTKAPDGDEVDFHMGPNPQSKKIFVVDQYDTQTKKYDEPKVFGGFDSLEQVTAAYDQAFSDGRGPERRGSITETTLDGLGEWLPGAAKPVPFAAAAPPKAPSKTTTSPSKGPEAPSNGGEAAITPQQAAVSQAVAPEMFVQIGNKRWQVQDFADASRKWEAARDKTGEGASKLPTPIIVDSTGKTIAEISYNGRVWPPGGFQPGVAPLYDNRQSAAPSLEKPDAKAPPAIGQEQPVTPADVHKLATEKGIPWDDAPAFMARTKAITGKERLDDLSPDQLRGVMEVLRSAPETFKGATPDNRVLSTGARLKSKSGRELSPVPKIEATTDRKTTGTLRRVDEWLLEEAKKEAAGNDYLTTILSGIDAKRMSQADRDTLNEVLFGGEGATEANLIKGPATTATKPPPPAAKAPLTVMEFLADKGIKVDDPALKELTHFEALRDWHKGKPFRKSILRADGLPLHKAIARAHEFGFLGKQAEVESDDAYTNEHLKPLDEALFRLIKGRETVIDTDLTKQIEKEEADRFQKQNRADMERAAEAYGIVDSSGLSDQELESLLDDQKAADDRIDAEERAAIQAVESELKQAENVADEEEIPFDAGTAGRPEVQGPGTPVDETGGGQEAAPVGEEGRTGDGEGLPETVGQRGEAPSQEPAAEGVAAEPVAAEATAEEPTQPPAVTLEQRREFAKEVSKATRLKGIAVTLRRGDTYYDPLTRMINIGDNPGTDVDAIAALARGTPVTGWADVMVDVELDDGTTGQAAAKTVAKIIAEKLKRAAAVLECVR